MIGVVMIELVVEINKDFERYIIQGWAKEVIQYMYKVLLMHVPNVIFTRNKDCISFFTIQLKRSKDALFGS